MALVLALLALVALNVHLLLQEIQIPLQQPQTQPTPSINKNIEIAPTFIFEALQRHRYYRHFNILIITWPTIHIYFAVLRITGLYNFSEYFLFSAFRMDEMCIVSKMPNQF